MAIRGLYITEDELGDVVYGEPSQGTLNYLRREMERYSDRVGQLFDGFFSDAREVFNQYNGVGALRRIRNRLRESSNFFDKDVIKPLLGLEDIQKAKPIMQRYIMAHPMSRELEANQSIDGYSDSYRNKYVGRAGFDDPDYMKVIDGIIFTDNYHDIKVREDEDAWVAYQDLIYDEEDRDLFLSEQVDILSTWDVLECFYKQKGKDPTSVLNEDM